MSAGAAGAGAGRGRGQAAGPSWLVAASYAARVGWLEYTSVMSARLWVLGWFGRVLAQVTFFALVGRLIGDEAQVAYLLIGNAVMLAAMQSLITVASTTWERRSGTLPLLVASPSQPGLVFIARSLHWIPEGVVSAMGALLVMAAVFGLRLPLGGTLATLPLIVLVGLTAYAFGSFLAAFVLRAMDLRNLASNLTMLAMMALCGVNVPIESLPAVARLIARALPLTHGLRAIRDLLAGAPLRAALPDALLELLVGACWLAAAVLAFRAFADGGRRDGTIELA